jgi:hypothetical protein
LYGEPGNPFGGAHTKPEQHGRPPGLHTVVTPPHVAVVQYPSPPGPPVGTHVRPGQQPKPSTHIVPLQQVHSFGWPGGTQVRPTPHGAPSHCSLGWFTMPSPHTPCRVVDVVEVVVVVTLVVVVAQPPAPQASQQLA